MDVMNFMNLRVSVLRLDYYSPSLQYICGTRITAALDAGVAPLLIMLLLLWTVSQPLHILPGNQRMTITREESCKAIYIL